LKSVHIPLTAQVKGGYQLWYKYKAKLGVSENGVSAKLYYHLWGLICKGIGVTSDMILKMSF